MNNQEMLKYLKGSAADKKLLFDHFLQKVMGGAMLSETETGMFEFLKNELLSKKPVVLEMSSTLKGMGGVNI